MILPQRELVVVMPVYNEADCIAPVVEQWRAMLSELAIDFEILVLNDGSTDSTQTQLERFVDEPRVRVETHANAGHGPTILRGYRDAVGRSKWVFQCDSDDEMSPDAFPKLWNRREKYDAIFGFRAGRAQNAARKFLSGGSRIVVKSLFGRGVRDVNVPYRLMRASVLKPIVSAIPDETFAPNIIISGVLSRRRAKLANLPVAHEGRRTGTASLSSMKVWRVAAKSLWQTLWFRMPR